MNKKIVSLIYGLLQIAAIAALVAVAFVFAQAPSEEEVLSAAGTITEEMATYVPSVQVISPNPTSVSITIETTGSIGYRSLVQLIPQVAGRVEWMSPAFRSGGKFAADETLLRIEALDYELGIQQAQADLAAAKADLELQQAESRAAIENWRLLNPTGEVPQLVAKVPQMKRTEAAIQVAEVRVSMARLELARTEFSLPFAGRVVEVNVSPGQFLARGQAFGTAYSKEALEARVPVSVLELSALDPPVGRRVSMSLNGSVLQGVVARVSAERDRISRVATLFVTLDENLDVAPGSFLESVRIYGPQLSDVFELPESTQQDEGNLWIVEAGRLVEHRPHVIMRQAGNFVVESFSYGDGIVVGLVPGAAEGLQVNTVDTRP